MRWKWRLEQALGWAAVPNVTLWLIVPQVALYLLTQLPAAPLNLQDTWFRLALMPHKVFQGEIYRLASFLLLPPMSDPICAFFFWWLFYLMGTSLERHWGTFKYNAFLWTGYVAVVGASFITQFPLVTNLFLEQSVFFAFAWLCPHFTLMIFFVIPVEIRWLAGLGWIGLIYSFVIVEDWSFRVTLVASVANFLIYFHEEIRNWIGFGYRRMNRSAGALARREPTFRHRCTTCGITDLTHPHVDFRYCSQCAGQHAYCPPHLTGHEHIPAEAPSTA